MFNFWTATVDQSYFDPDGELDEEEILLELHGPGTRVLEDHMVLHTGPVDMGKLKDEFAYWVGSDRQGLEKAELELLTGYWFMCFEEPRLRHDGTWQVTFCKFEEADVEEIAA